MQKTLQALVTATEKALYQSAGPSVQIYAQSILEQHINEAFKHCYRAVWWPQYRKREVRTLDALTGQVTLAFTHIASWDDIQHVFRRGSDIPLRQLPASFNTLNMQQTTTPLFIEASGDSKLFTVYPLGSEGDIVVVGRKTYGEFAATDVVPFDDQALVHYAAWSYFTDDASNPASALKHQGLFETRIKKLKDDNFSHAIALDPRSGFVPDQWYEAR